MSHLNGGSSILSNHAPEPKQPQFSASMLWGRSDLKEKFYSGESSASPWVRDLLWKANIVAEKKKLGMTGLSIESMPPHMRSVHAAKMQAEEALKLQTMERVKGEKMLQAQVQQKLQMDGSGGGGDGVNRGKLTSRSTSSGFQLPGSRHMQRSRKGAQSARRLPALNLDVLKSGGGSRRYKLVAGDTERGSRMSSTRSIRSSYSRGSSRASSRRSMRSSASTSSAAVTRLASLLKSQNEQLRRGMQQQVRWCWCCFVCCIIFLFFFRIIIAHLFFLSSALSPLLFFFSFISLFLFFFNSFNRMTHEEH